ncbi:type I restriction endonuclease subunit R [Bifidobacterium sp. BRDM6]|uniref:Type I restriction enzyme endonuclease subunit n=2 Tax=Bifidobacterium choloepi TaxID=2614131 RepID=A0A6I5NK33_9BIFI|nr:type I restriction endonuclease subunit R [Bifidobacterium choloepi]
MKNEAEFEEELIHYLESIGGTKQWRYEPGIKTIDGLWNNFRTILNRNNADKLGGQPLTDNEFAQIKTVISSLKTPYDAGRWIYGMNGVTQVEIERDEPNDAAPNGHAFLTVFDQDQVGAGNTVYQIVNQIQRPHVQAGRKDSRFDTTLLINGLPIIHIEEKFDGHDAIEALNQIHQYIQVGAFSEIYSTVQIFVGMTPHMARYMANTTAENFNLAFAFRWQREHDSKPVSDWKEFCNLMLSIPMAHQMATNYMILDSDPHHRNLMVMRPYQVYATRRVIDKLRTHVFGVGGNQEVGYVWHTTGSGKTISSFKTAWLASRLPNVDKVVFVVDRIALTDQTYEKYQAYDPDTSEENGEGVIVDTNNTGELARKLKSRLKANSIIVTSIQKLSRLVSRKNFKAPDQNIVFIVDEAHRSTNGPMMEQIKHAFPQSAWVGYTGTPVFDGDMTHGVFGDLIHAYTIREAIADRNVLGFKVDFENTIDEDDIKEQLLPELIKRRYPDWDDNRIEHKIARMSPDEVDDYIDSGIYDDNHDHVKAVVDDILKHWRNRSHDGRYSAMLTTHVGGGKPSANMAMMYFDEFQKRNQQLIDEGKRPLNVAVTFSYATDNSDSMVAKNNGLRRAIETYNATFGTAFDDTTVDQYFSDVTQRLKGEAEGEKLDICIVIDQLLTGFDAKMVNTLYVDRTLSGANLIQAYSRTNRIDNFDDKPNGRIVNYRWPQTSKKLMDAALAVYANRDSALVQGTIGEALKDEGLLAKDHAVLVDEAREVVESLAELTDNFTQIPPSEAAQQKLLTEYARYNGLVGKLKEDDSYDYDRPELLLEQLGLTADDEHRVYGYVLDVKRRIQERSGEEDLPVDLDFSVQHIAEVEINYDYINELLAALINCKHSGDDENTENAFQRVVRAIDQLPDRKQAEQYKAVASGIVDGSMELDDVSYPVEADDVPEIVRNVAGQSRRRAILKFKEKWGLVDIVTANFLIDKMLERHVVGDDDTNLGNELTDLVTEAQKYYKEDAADEDIRKLSKIKYNTSLKKAFREFADYIVNHYGE